MLPIALLRTLPRRKHTAVYSIQAQTTTAYPIFTQNNRYRPNLRFQHSMTSTSLLGTRPVLLLCDIQERFRPHIHEFSAMCAVSHRLIQFAKVLDIPVYATEQVPSKFGSTVADVGVECTSNLEAALAGAREATRRAQSSDSAVAKAAMDSPLPAFTTAKTKFSMASQQLDDFLAKVRDPKRKTTVLLFGIEAHVCVLQTALDLAARGDVRVAIVADAVSSIEPVQRKVALERAAQAGCIVTTSESLLFELLGDASHPQFRTAQRILMQPPATKDVVSRILSNL